MKSQNKKSESINRINDDLIIHGVFNNERKLADIYQKERNQRQYVNHYSIALIVLFALMIAISSYIDTVQGVYPSI